MEKKTWFGQFWFFSAQENSKKWNTDIRFFSGEKWVSLANQCTSEFLKVKTLKSIFPGVNIIKSVHSLNETKPVIARSITTATGGKSVLQTEKKIANESFKKPLSNFHLLKTWKAVKSTNHNMREFLGINKLVRIWYVLLRIKFVARWFWSPCFSPGQ